MASTFPIAASSWSIRRPVSNGCGYYSTHCYGVESAGIHCIVVDVKDGGFEYDITPSASTDSTYTQKTVLMEVTICDVNFDVAGTKPDDMGGLQCLVGQNQIATVGTGYLYAVPKGWNVPGSGVFGRVLTDGPPRTNMHVDPQPDGSASTYVGDHEYDPMLVITTTPRYAGDPDGQQQASFCNALAEPETITCTVEMHDANTGTKLDTVTLTRIVTVVPPSNDFMFEFPRGQDTRILPDCEDTSKLRMYSAAISFNYDAGTPESPVDFVGTGDAGKVAICQLVQDDRVYTPSTVDHPHTGTTGFWLDNAYPFPKSLYFARAGAINESDLRSAPDIPSEPLDPDWDGVSIHNVYETTMLYQPPGVNSEYVPISTLGWYWQASASQGKLDPKPIPPGQEDSAEGQTWIASGHTAQSNLYGLYYLPFVTWLRAYINGEIYDKP